MHPLRRGRLQVLPLSGYTLCGCAVGVSFPASPKWVYPLWMYGGCEFSPLWGRVGIGCVCVCNCPFPTKKINKLNKCIANKLQRSQHLQLKVQWWTRSSTGSPQEDGQSRCKHRAVPRIGSWRRPRNDQKWIAFAILRVQNSNHRPLCSPQEQPIAEPEIMNTIMV